MMPFGNVPQEVNEKQVTNFGVAGWLDICRKTNWAGCLDLCHLARALFIEPKGKKWCGEDNDKFCGQISSIADKELTSVHVSDWSNEQNHLALGEGNIPLERTLELLKKNPNIKSYVLELEKYLFNSAMVAADFYSKQINILKAIMM